MMRVLLIVMMSLAFVGTGTARGQSPTELDTRAQKLLAEHPDSGILFIDAVMRDAKGQPMRCFATTLSLVNVESQKVTLVKTSEDKLIGDNMYGGAELIKSGVYVVAGLTCEMGPKNFYHGSFAKVAVRAGEIVSAGTLVIDYTKTGFIFRPSFSGTVHTENFAPKTLASLKARFPLTLARAKKTSLVALSEQERKNGVAPSRQTTPVH